MDHTITEIFQTPDAHHTVVLIRDLDGTVSIGIARAGKYDIESGLVTPEKGIEVAQGRANKVRATKQSLCEKNYLRGIRAEFRQINQSYDSSGANSVVSGSVNVGFKKCEYADSGGSDSVDVGLKDVGFKF